MKSKNPPSNISKEYLEFETLSAMNSSDSHFNPNQERDFLNESSRIILPSKSSLLLKFIPLSLISGFLSLFICPQFGLSPYNLEPEFLSSLLHQNLFICGLYCGVIYYAFLSLTVLVIFNIYEKTQFLKHFTYLPFALCSASWGLFMALSHSHLKASTAYNLGWFVAIAIGLTLSLIIKNKQKNLRSLS